MSELTLIGACPAVDGRYLVFLRVVFRFALIPGRYCHDHHIGRTGCGVFESFWGDLRSAEYPESQGV